MVLISLKDQEIEPFVKITDASSQNPLLWMTQSAVLGEGSEPRAMLQSISQYAIDCISRAIEKGAPYTESMKALQHITENGSHQEFDCTAAILEGEMIRCQDGGLPQAQALETLLGHLREQQHPTL